MKLAVVKAYFSRPSVGGGELHTERLARALAARGHDVTVHTDAPEDRRDLSLPHGVDVVEHETPSTLTPVNEFALGRRVQPALRTKDAVLFADLSAWTGLRTDTPSAHVFHLVWHGWVAANGLGYTLHNKPHAFVYRQLERRICREADRLVAIAPAIEADLDGLAPDDRFVRIPNAVDTDAFHPSPDRASEFTVHFQGRLVGMKNPDVLVEAARESDEDWRLTLGGTGPMGETLRDRVDDYGLQNRVEFLGYVPDSELADRYARSHVCALPSTYEGMPLTVLEAAACGTAIVASPRAATDFVTPEIGRVCAPAPNAVAETLDSLARDPAGVERMGAAARRRAEGYTWDRIASEYEQVFTELAEGKT